MTRYLAAMAFAILAAAPAAAQPRHIAAPPYAASGADAYAQAPGGRAHPYQQRLNRSDAVIDEGGQVEVDPDVNIRSQLERENNQP
jgi:hypothetical protein